MELSENSSLARFITSKNGVNKGLRKIKAVALMPKDEKDLSVFMVDGLDDAEVWKIWEAHIRTNKLFGRGDLPTIAYRAAGLHVDFNNTPPRHVNIEGWPKDKDAQKSIAQKLAAQASSTILDEPIKRSQ